MNQPNSTTTLYAVRTATIAALYVALTYAFAFMSYGPVQFRVSEALTILPLIFPESILGLFIGCIIANMLSTPFDILLGSFSSLAAATTTFLIGHAIRNHKARVGLGIIPPILYNAILVPVIILVSFSEYSYGYWLDFCFVLIGQTAVITILGIPLYFTLIRLTKTHPSIFGSNQLTRQNPPLDPPQKA